MQSIKCLNESKNLNKYRDNYITQKYKNVNIKTIEK